VGKDYRIGLITGLILAIAALLWVATRPSLTPRPYTVPSTEEKGPWAVSPDPTPGPAPASSKSEEGGLRQESKKVRDEEGKNSFPSIASRADSGPQPAPGEPIDLTIYEKSEPIKTTRFHIVRQGETLSTIAQQYYGSQNGWRKILTANAKAVKDPNKIAPGTKLIIP